MKQLKKNPLVQRMEDMVTPDGKFVNKSSKKKSTDKWSFSSSSFTPGTCWYHPTRPAVVMSGTLAYNLCQSCLDRERKITMTGREWLRSINDDLGFTLMPRIVWRVVAVGVLVGAVIHFFTQLWQK